MSAKKGKYVPNQLPKFHFVNFCHSLQSTALVWQQQGTFVTEEGLVKENIALLSPKRNESVTSSVKELFSEGKLNIDKKKIPFRAKWSMKSDVLPKNRISNRDSSCTYCAGRARGTVHLLWRVLLFLRQCGHGRVQRRARAGVRENKRGLSSRRGVTGLLEVTVTLFERRCLQQVSLFFLEL